MRRFSMDSRELSKSRFGLIFMAGAAVLFAGAGTADPTRIEGRPGAWQTRILRPPVRSDLAKLLLEPVRVPVEAKGPSRGPANAPVTLVEFGDFQCPFCARFVPTLDQIFAYYGDKVRLVFRQYPLAMHPHALKAAEASLCAQEQGKFWEMHEAMFKNQSQLQVEHLKATAAELGLNVEQFNQALDSGKYTSSVQADLQAGAAAGVSGAPALFVNGRFISGAVPYEQIAQVIDDELRRIADKLPF